MSRTDRDCARLEIRSLHPQDYPAARSIIAEGFPEEARDNPAALERYDQEPWYDPEHLLVAGIDGRVVSQMGLRDGTLVFGDVAVPACLVGTVCTLEAYRGQGIGTRMMRAAFERMERFSAAVSCVHTSAQRYAFYGRLGYRPAVISIPRLSLRLDALDLPWDHPVTTRRAQARDAPLLARMYDAHYGRLAGSWSRSAAFWACRIRGLPKLWSRPVEFRLPAHRSPAAYLGFRTDEETLFVEEWACLPGGEDQALDLLHAVLVEARESGASTATLALAARDPLRALRVERGSRGSATPSLAATAQNPQHPLLEGGKRRSATASLSATPQEPQHPLLADLPLEDHTTLGTVLLRIQNFARFSAAVRPLLERRARETDCRVSLRMTDSGHRLDIGEGKALTLEMEESDLCALVYNGRRLSALIEDGRIEYPAGEREILQQIFPDTGAARRHLDSY